MCVYASNQFRILVVIDWSLNIEALIYLIHNAEGRTDWKEKWELIN